MKDICNDEYKGNAFIYNFTFIQQQEESAEEVIVHIDGYYCDEYMETNTGLPWRG